MINDLSSVVPGGMFQPVNDVDPEPDLFFTPEELASPTDEPMPDDDRFDERISEDVEGLLYLGALSRTIEVGSHRIVIRTLKAGEELACAQVIKDFDGTLAQSRAFTAARVAASIETVDGSPLTTALGPGDTLSVVRSKFQYIMRNWYWPLIEEVFTATEELMIRQNIAYAEVSGKSKASLL